MCKSVYVADDTSRMLLLSVQFLKFSSFFMSLILSLNSFSINYILSCKSSTLFDRLSILSLTILVLAVIIFGIDSSCFWNISVKSSLISDNETAPSFLFPTFFPFPV